MLKKINNLQLSYSKIAFGFVAEPSYMFLLSNHQVIYACWSFSHLDVVNVYSTDKQSWNNGYQITCKFLSYQIITVQFMVVNLWLSRGQTSFFRTDLLFFNTYNSCPTHNINITYEKDSVVKHYKYFLL